MNAVENAGQRLRAELGRLIRAIPSESRSVRTMAAFLEVDRNTCQRVIAASHPSGSGTEAFLRLPGIKPLRTLISQARLHGVDVDLIESLSAAVERLSDVVTSFDESHQRLKARIEATLATIGRTDRGEKDGRRVLFEEHARLLQRRLDVHSLITAIGPHSDDESRLEQAWVRGLVGLRMDRGAMPLALGTSTTEPEPGMPTLSTFDPLSRRTVPGERTSGLIEGLSSMPAPTLTTRSSAGAQVLVIDPPAEDTDHAMDIAIATRVAHVENPKKTYHTSAVMTTPAARVVFDVYLHRSLALASVPACGVFQYTMSFSVDMDENWPFRLPGQYRLELLGPGLTNAASTAWVKHAEAAKHLFARTGWRAEEYVGHRMEVEFPMWGSTLYQWFDFGARTSNV